MLGTMMIFQDGADLEQFVVLGEDTGDPSSHSRRNKKRMNKYKQSKTRLKIERRQKANFRLLPETSLIIFPSFLIMNHQCIKVHLDTVPLKSKLPVASRFRRDANLVARYAIRVARESSKRKMSGINNFN